jgi:PIN domain nuclease of toxin-antitoxin system
MRGLLDTHTFIWWDSTPSKLSAAALSFLQNRANTILLSVASVWEMVIKIQLGKLTLHAPLVTILTQQQANGLQILPVALAHVLALESLPTHHKDPFDRLLVAQTKLEADLILSADPVFVRYGVKVLW